MNQLIKSKKAAVEWYSWFMLFATLALLVIALFAFAVKHGSVPYESLGQAALISQNLIYKKEILLRQTDAVVDTSANVAAKQMSFKFGVLDSDKGYSFYNGAPILVSNKDTINLPDLQSNFIDTFISELKVEGMYVRDPSRKLMYSMDMFYVLDYNSNSISLVNGKTIYGFSLKVKTLEQEIKTGRIELKYYPDFRYDFQNYSFLEYQEILSNVSVAVSKVINNNECDMTKIRPIFDAHNNASVSIKEIKRYNIYLNNDCTKYLNSNNAFQEYYVKDVTQYKFEKPTKANCQVLVCVEDKDRLLSGLSHLGAFKVGNPIYRFAIVNKEKNEVESVGNN